MSSFEDAIARMKDLYTYGKEVNESNNLKTHTLEHRAVAADGVTYGIIRENSKYYIKSAPKGKETIAEAYDYLGGFCNKGNYEYNSYAKALKQFELKLASINEAHDQKVNIESLNPFRSHQVLQEATDAMRDEIARQRQIMYNVAMLMNESTEIGADRKDDVVKYDGKNAEAETGKKGDEGSKEAKAEPEYAGSKTNGVDKKAAPFDQGAGSPKDQLKEEASDIGDAPLHPNTENWGTEGIGKGEDPKTVGWEMDGQKTVNEEDAPINPSKNIRNNTGMYAQAKGVNPSDVRNNPAAWDGLNEEENDWASKGLPSTPGVGEADTDHNNDPFNKGVNESEDFDDDANVEAGDELDGEMGDEDFTEDDVDLNGLDDEDDDLSTDTDFDAGIEDGEGDDLGTEGDLDADLDAEDNLGDEGELGGDNSDILAQIDELQAQIDALRAQIGGGDEEPAVDDVAGEEPKFEGDAESFTDGDGDAAEEDFSDESDDDFGSEDMKGEEGDDFSDEGEESFDDDENLDECPMGDDMQQPMMESKKKIMDKIVESVVRQIVNEDELHVFGKHPGYRKKPMELPTTGEDKNQWGEDWNDESVHNEEPFGSKIGDGDPFNQLVDAVTKDVMYQLKAGIPIEGENKKKE